MKGTLNQELEALRGLIDPLVWQAIDVVRGVGNIGAHMEKDINVIVDVEPNEAVRLLRLIELLISEWYVARHRRQEELQAIITIGEEKQKARKAGRNVTHGESAAANPDPVASADSDAPAP